MRKILLVSPMILSGIIRLNAQSASPPETIKLAPGHLHPLYIITADNKRLELQDTGAFGNSLSLTAVINQINHTLIQSISVMQDENSFGKYGASGQDGVIFIELKQGSLTGLPANLADKFIDVKR